jgi:hypothetical protein
MEQSIIETLTHASADSYSIGAKLRLQWEMLCTQWSLNQGKRLRKSFSWFRRDRRHALQS